MVKNLIAIHDDAHSVRRLNWKTITIVCLLVGLFFIFILDFGFRVNRSSSLSSTVFLSKKTNDIRVGEYALFVHPKYDYALAKQIIAKEGDEIAICQNSLFINDVYFGKLQSHNSSGQTLKPVASGLIPKGYVFAYGTHERSFDSRYSDFGLVNCEWIQEKLWPIF